MATDLTTGGTALKVVRLAIPDVLLITPRIFRDDRGHFMETWRAASYAEQRIGPFVQENVSVSRRNVLRGLHLQHPHGQGKLVGVLSGAVFDVAVDVRVGSPTFGKWVSEELSSENGRQLYIPPGFAHGFLAVSDEVVFAYKCTDYYAPTAERSIRWNDEDLAINWPVAVAPVLGAKDAAAPPLRDIPLEQLPRYQG